MLRRLFSGKPITKLRFEPPAPASERHGVAVILIVRNEARHIAEWARFHLSAGVRHIYVYDNGSTDDTAGVLAGVAQDRATIIPWDQKLRDAISGREIHNQVLAYAHAIRNFGAQYRWMAAIDADEFVVPVQANSLPEALVHLSDCRAIALPWHNFGRNGHDKTPPGGVLENYTRRAADPTSGERGVSNFKTIVDPCHVTAIKVHSYEIDGEGVACNDLGQPAKNADRGAAGFYSAQHVQLNHYYSRSEEELSAKIARGSNQSVAADRHAARVRRNVANIEAQEVEDRCALEFLARIDAANEP